MSSTPDIAIITQILERLPAFELAGAYERFEDAGEVHAGGSCR